MSSHDLSDGKLNDNADMGEDDAIDIALGKRLKSLRVQTGKTQADIAAILGVSPQQYQKYEKGMSKCSLENLFLLAAYYNLSVAHLIPDAFGAPPSSVAHGLEETAEPFTPAPHKTPEDEASLIAEVTALFIRIPSHETRRKLIDLLSEITQ